MKNIMSYVRTYWDNNTNLKSLASMLTVIIQDKGNNDDMVNHKGIYQE
jgi:hypothetical protein